MPIVIFLLLVLCFSVLIGVGGYFYAQAAVDYYEQDREKQHHDAVEVATQVLRQRLRVAVEDAAFLSGQVQFSGALERPSALNRQRMMRDFMAYASARRSVAQVRWIDETGMERVRVDSGDGQVKAVPQAELQDKSARNYVRRTLALPEGGIYVSPLDLNIERGQIQTPYVPTMRFAMPLFDGDGGRRGLVIINFRAREWLDAFARAAGNMADRLMLVDSDGYWLRNPDAQKEWGAELDAPQMTLARGQAAAWQAISARRQGLVLLDDGLWAWASVEPLRIARQSLWQVGVDGAPRVAGERSYTWHAVVHRPATGRTELLKDVFWHTLAFPLAVLFGISVGVAAWVSRSQWLIARLNRELAQRATMAEAANRAKAEFVANISHEIRTPMNAVVGIAHVLERIEHSRDTQRMVGQIRRAARSLQGLIEDVLDFSKIDAGRLEIEQKRFYLGDVLDHLATLMAMNAGEKDIELIIAPPPPSIDVLVGDGLRLEQILVNLTSNAIKFTDHGSVEVRISVLELTERQTTLRFAVRDTGIGIAADQQERIFSEFTQVEASAIRRFRGAGLGLAICRRLIDMMGGQIGVLSNPGTGSEFWVALTFGRERAERRHVVASCDFRVLIADDNPVALGALVETAEVFGWQVDGARSKNEALHCSQTAIDNHAPHDAIVLDWSMPGMGGMDDIRAFRAAFAPQRVPAIILAVSAAVSPEMSAIVDDHSVDEVLTKPVTASALHDAVSRACDFCHVEPRAAMKTELRLVGIRALVVDDNSVNREVAKRLLSLEGAEVVLASDGQKALDWLLAHAANVDVVLMDLQMPNVDGYEATRRIRDLPQFAQLPIIALTAVATLEERQAAMTAGITEYITKPFDPEVAVAIIRRLVPHAVPAVARDVVCAPSAAPVPSAAHVLPEQLPGLAIQQGLAIWKDADVYRQYLRRFVRDYAGAAKAMTQTGPIDAALLVHQLRGVAANLALHGVVDAAGDIERVLLKQAGAKPAIQRLQAALDIAIASIREYAPRNRFSEIRARAAMDPKKVAELLSRLMQSFEAHTLDSADSILLELDAYLSIDQLAPLAAAVEGFDFTAGENAIHILADELNLRLERTP